MGGLRLILEFGSITFLLLSFLMAIANFKLRKRTNSSRFITLIAIIGLFMGTVLILIYEYQSSPEQLLFIMMFYALLSLGAWGYSRIRESIYKD